MEQLFNYIADFLKFDPTHPLIFSSGAFLWLFILFYALFISTERNRNFRIIYVLAFSLFFYYKSSGIYFVLLIISTVLDYVLGHMIYRSEGGKRKFYMILSLIGNLGMLGYFKYTNFFIDILNSITGEGFQEWDIILPVGISFFTFQTLSYSIDIYRGNLKPCDNILEFGFFVSFFPQLVAGPIVRAVDFLPQIREKLQLSSEGLSRAFFLIMGGLFKKVVISDYISVNFVDRVFDDPSLYTGTEALLAAYGYAIQIYCDFSGYSDMAIGLALLMGFRLPDNFNAPYMSTSITDFWRRWHMSLSSWLRDYLYISMGGNRKGNLRTYFNLMMTMLLGGLWHGASWRFIFWGAMHGGALAIERMFKPILKPFDNKPWRKYFTPLQVFITFNFVTFCWVFFRAKSFKLASDLLGRIATDFRWDVLGEILVGYQNVMLLILLGFILHAIPRSFENQLQKVYAKTPLVLQAFLFSLIMWAALQMMSSDIQPFIYFQF